MSQYLSHFIVLSECQQYASVAAQTEEGGLALQHVPQLYCAYWHA